jgi:hypothetical protein
MSAFFFVCLFIFFLGKLLNKLTILFFVRAMTILLHGSTTRAEQACRWSFAATLEATFCEEVSGDSYKINPTTKTLNTTIINFSCLSLTLGGINRRT